jgi:hypothetical protein
MEMNEDERAKILVSAVVSQKCEKRLWKTFAHREAERLKAGRGCHDARRPGIAPSRR